MQTESSVPMTETVSSVSETVSFETLYNSMVEQLNNAYATVKNVKSNLKMLETRHRREIKQSRKNRRRVVNTATPSNKNPSGFNKPGPVPQKIKDLLHLDSAVELPRTQITKLIYGYIKEHNLQKPTDKRVIIPNTEIRNLFGISDTDTTEISFYNIQTYIKKLYPTTAQTSEQAPTPTPAPVQVQAPAPAPAPVQVQVQAPTPVTEQLIVTDTAEQLSETVAKSKSAKNKKKAPKKTNTSSAVSSA
jgi:chromatin remodeling complex protein RSC6